MVIGGTIPIFYSSVGFFQLFIKFSNQEVCLLHFSASAASVSENSSPNGEH